MVRAIVNLYYATPAFKIMYGNANDVAFITADGHATLHALGLIEIHGCCRRKYHKVTQPLTITNDLEAGDDQVTRVP